MRFLVDECTGPAVARWLEKEGHDVLSVFDEARGADDEQIIQTALDQDWILVTNDKDFGAKVYRDGRLHRGVILLRLADESVPGKIDALLRLLQSYPERVGRSFIVVTDTQVRFGRD